MMIDRNVYRLGGAIMTVHERILMLRLLEKQARNPDYVNKIGVHVSVAVKAPDTSRKGDVLCLK